jgi:cell volume regulation protein A
MLGYALARAAVWCINRLQLDNDGLYPVFTVAFVLLTLEGVTWVGGSGFLAVYVAGVTMAHHDYLHKRSLVRFHDAIAWLLQIAMFVLLGLLVFPDQLPEVAVQAVVVAVLLMFVARPIAVGLTLLPFRLPYREIGFVSWVGLRGATPIILATFPVAAGVPDAERIFDVVFFVVLTSVLVQGASIPFAARRFGMVEDGAATRPVSFDTVITGDEGPRLREIVVEPGADAVGRQLVDLGLPRGVLLVLVRRGPTTFMPQGSTTIEEGDELLVAVDREYDDDVITWFRGADPMSEREERTPEAPADRPIDPAD